MLTDVCFTSIGWFIARVICYLSNFAMELEASASSVQRDQREKCNHCKNKIKGDILAHYRGHLSNVLTKTKNLDKEFLETDNNLQQYKADVKQKEKQLKRKRKELEDQEQILDIDKTTLAEFEADNLQDHQDYNKCQENVVLLRDAITKYREID
ncbi:hypothetical protein QE152_g33958 [Popillia japonica]|uniref:Uncharacterized protein n=1 Tax=Popillia japonica TaxID=7064 RepID=A0AAW1IV26_POPJA